MKITHILHPTDFSECSEAAMEHVRELARQHGAELTLMYVIDDISRAQGWYVPHISLGEFYKEMEEQARKKLEHCCYENLRDFKNVNRVVIKGSPADEILKYADGHRVDMIVMGTHAKSGAERLFQSTVEKVMRKARCSVLCVKAPEAAAA